MDDMKDQLLTYRRKDGRVNIAVHTEDDFRHVLGNYYDGCHSGSFDPSKWKRAIEKMVSKLEIAIKRNVDTDAMHRDDIARDVRLIKEGIAEGAKGDPQVIVKLIALAFELMGEMPYNAEVEHATHEKYFTLNRHRTVRYHQNPRQRAYLIIDVARWGVFKELSEREIQSKYYHEFHQEPLEFLDWFKTAHPTVYCKLF